jgi:hypothetical protein
MKVRDQFRTHKGTFYNWLPLDRTAKIRQTNRKVKNNVLNALVKERSKRS